MGLFNWWWSRRLRSIVLQTLLLIAIICIGTYFIWNASANLDRQNLNFGFDFLSREASFGIGETVLEYSTQASFGRAFVIGLANTVVVSLYALVIATFLGFAVGIGSLSRNRSLRSACLGYVALFRNVPLLLQLYLWYSVLTGLLPPAAEAWTVFGIHIARVGIFFPTVHFEPTPLSLLIGGLAALMAGLASWRFWSYESTSILTIVRIGILSLLVGGLALLVAGGGEIREPVWEKFRFNGGVKFSPEFSALLFGLAIYTASFIAEIVRAGILAVKKGQTEAAYALGLTSGQTLKLIIIPQARRLIVPPLTSQYLNLVKNSSLGVAIGYPDLVSIANTTINISGRAVECVAITMAVYLSLSLVISAAMNVYHRKTAIQER
nr:ABC transporter permease subunit [Brucella pituitosa]